MLVHFSADGPLGCVHLSAAAIRAATSTTMKVFLRSSAFTSFGCIPRNRSADFMISLFLIL